MTRPMIELTGVFKAFGENRVLNGVDLVVGEGQTFVLLGGSGSGKTVLMKHVEGLLKPDRGVVRVDGRNLAELDVHALEEVRRELGIQFQSGALFDSMTVYDNVAFPLRELGHLKSGSSSLKFSALLLKLATPLAASAFHQALDAEERRADDFAAKAQGTRKYLESARRKVDAFS